MDKLSVHSTSAKSAEVSDIVLRQTQTTRLIFRPMLVENPSDSRAAVNGIFVFQRKGVKDTWTNTTTIPLSNLKKDEGYKLEISSKEVLKLFEGLADLYELHAQEGVPRGTTEYVRVNRKFAQLVAMSESQLRQILAANDAMGMDLLAKLLSWATDADDPRSLVTRLIGLGPANLRKLNVAVGLQSLKLAIAKWHDNENVDDEEFWQNTLTENSFVLEHVFSWPVTIVKGKAYLGGKSVMNRGGKIVDFLLKHQITTNAALVEIKTPATDLLGGEYRAGIFTPSEDLSGAVMQVLAYKHSLERDYLTITAGQSRLFEAFDPPCVVIVGNAERQLSTADRRQSFELLRGQHHGVRVITFDELFGKTEQLVEVLESSGDESVVEDDLPF